MPQLTLRYYSEALQKQTKAELILPAPGTPGPYRVMFLLHGLSDDETIWLRRTSIERYCEGKPWIVVMPDGGRGWYCDAIAGYAFGTAIGVELPQIVELYFPTTLPWATTGLSMGGYGALRLALTYPERFGSAVSHSGALHYGHWAPMGEDDRYRTEALRIVGDNPSGGPNDLYSLALSMSVNKLPMMRIDCGTEDFLLQSNRDFNRHLMDNNIPHEYEEFPGDHNWAYWDLHVQEALDFHARFLESHPR